eukprot:4093526-Amphidinium_carterae.1
MGFWRWTPSQKRGKMKKNCPKLRSSLPKLGMSFCKRPSCCPQDAYISKEPRQDLVVAMQPNRNQPLCMLSSCLLYTSDAADDTPCVDL